MVAVLCRSLVRICACLVVILSANALWVRIQQVQDDPQAYSDPSHRMELPFPFPGASVPIDRFELHEQSQISTFTYMGRTRFAHLLNELPAPQVHINAAIAAREHSASSLAPPASAAIPPTNAATSAAAAACASVSPPFFPPILPTVRKKSNTTFIYGTIGWGKSHLLAAMVCLLMRKGRKVVYLPDCKAMLRDPVDYFRSALLLTYAAQPTVQAQVVELLTIEDVIFFCKRHTDLTYIIDQYNALEQDTQKDDKEMLEKKKASARGMIERATCDRAVVLAASANNLTARIIHDKQLHMNIQTLFGGMDEVCSAFNVFGARKRLSAVLCRFSYRLILSVLLILCAQEETTCWYKHYNCLRPGGAAASSSAPVSSSTPAASASASAASAMDVVTASASSAGNSQMGVEVDVSRMRQRLEDVTGCIPLYLNCFVDCPPSAFAATWKDKFAKEKRVQRVYHHLLSFHRSLLDKHKESVTFRDDYVQVLRSFLLGGKPLDDEYDHRYLYEDKAGDGHVACGLARDCVAAAIRVLEWDREFVGGNFLTHIKTTRNPSVRGFLIEQACLTYIRRNGFLLPDGVRIQPQRVVYFDTDGERDALLSAPNAPCVLYIPRPFNYKAIDAIVRCLTFTQGQYGQQVISHVHLLPIQITDSGSHKHSPSSFYPRHHVWLEDLEPEVQRKHTFVWVKRTQEEMEVRDEQVRGMRNQEIVTPRYEEVTITFGSLSPALHVNTSPPRATVRPAATVASIAPIAFSLLGQSSNSLAVHPGSRLLLLLSHGVDVDSLVCCFSVVFLISLCQPNALSLFRRSHHIVHCNSTTTCGRYMLTLCCGSMMFVYGGVFACRRGGWGLCDGSC